jgi:ribonuclease HI
LFWNFKIVTPETTIKYRKNSHTTIFSAEQEAIIKAIYISKGNITTVIATDSLSTMMAVEATRWTKNPKTRRIRELLDQEKGRVKLMWIPSHSGVMGNKRADEAARNALEEDINNRELYPPRDLFNWMKKTDAKNGQEN